MTRFPAWIRLLSVLAVALIAGEHTLASLHQALTPHELCAEHGELVHSEHQADTDTARDTGPAFDASPQAEAEHHHCGVVPAAPARAPAATPGNAYAVAPPALILASRPFERPVLSLDVLAFAPKLSPPA
jgi:hypothetical protein